MYKNKLIQYVLFLLMLFAASGAYAALTVTVDFGDDLTYGDIENAIKSELEGNDVLGKYSDLPDLTRGFGNANTYASNGVTMRGYQGYDLISIAVGTMVTIQAPNADPMFFMELQDQLDNGDVYAGLGVNPIVGQVGLNMGFIIPDLYISFRFGKLDYKIDAGDYKLDYDTNLFGILLNYQIFAEKSILARLLVWRGLSLESGFIYSTNNVVYYKKIDQMDVYYDQSGPGEILANVDPSLDLELNIKSYIVPVEVYSSIRIFYFANIGAGVGFDYVVGNTTDLTLHSGGDTVIVSSPGNALDGDTGTIDVDAGTKGEADKFRWKFMANVGFGFGPVIIDIPLTFYLDNGYAVGLSAGVVW